MDDQIIYLSSIDPVTGKQFPSHTLRKVFISNSHTSLCHLIGREIIKLITCATVYFGTEAELINDIENLITSCDAVILALTKDTITDDVTWKTVVPMAQKNGVGIIPLVLDVSQNDLLALRQNLNGIQTIPWQFSSNSGIDSVASISSEMRLLNALRYFVINNDLRLQVDTLFKDRKHLVPINTLSPKDWFLMGYGYLKGVSIEKNPTRGIELLGMVASLSNDSPEIKHMRGQAAKILMDYYKLEKEDNDAAYKYLQIAISADNPETLYQIGCSRLEAGHAQSGALLIAKAAELRELKAVYLMAVLHLRGLGVKQDNKTAIEYASLASDLGSIEAKNLLGLIYNGIGTKPAKQIAFQWFSRAASLNMPNALSNLGVMYENGEIVEKDIFKAIDLYEKAFLLGHDIAGLNLGRIYFSGKGVEADKAKAMSIYNEVEENGSCQALYSLALLYLSGDDIEKDVDKAIQLLESLAELKHPESMNILGRIFESDEYGVKNITEAVKKYKEAHHRGCLEATYNLARLYYHGKGVPRDYAQARKLFEKCADSGFAEAMHIIGVMYYNGDGVPIDKTKAIEMWQKAADHGSIKALLDLGESYLNGDGISADRSKAFELYRSASEMGSEDAKRKLMALQQQSSNSNNEDINTALRDLSSADEMYDMGQKYFSGEFGDIDEEKAIFWLKKGAEMDHIPSLELLGLIYHHRNEYDLARDAYNKAVSLGSLDAKMGLATLNAEAALEEDTPESIMKGMKSLLDFLSESGLAEPQSKDTSDDSRKNIFSDQNILETISEQSSSMPFSAPSIGNVPAASSQQIELTYVTPIDGTSGKRMPATTLKKVFISYKRTDNELSDIRDTLINYLEDFCPCAIWNDSALTPGLYFDNEIKHAIASCDVVLLLLTKDIMHSKYVWETEIDTAIKCEKPIVGIYYDISDIDLENALTRIPDKYPVFQWAPENDMFRRLFINSLIKSFNAKSDVDESTSFFSSGKHLFPIEELTPNEWLIFGRSLITGCGCEKDIQRGRSILEMIMKLQDNSNAISQLKEEAASLLLQNGLQQTDPEFQAIENDADALFILGCKYQSGKGKKVDLQKAIAAFELAAKLGSIQALYQLGYLYKTHGTGPDALKKAYNILQKASEIGHIKSMILLSEMCFAGEGTTRDPEKGIFWLIQAANGGSTDAQCYLGEEYLSGQNIDRDYEKAFGLLSMAADQGNSEAMAHLGLMYFHGEGVDVDIIKAEEWLTKSVMAGNDRAFLTLLALKSIMKNDDAINISREAQKTENNACKGHAT